MLLWLIQKEGGAQSVHQPQQLSGCLSLCPARRGAWCLGLPRETLLCSEEHEVLQTCSTSVHALHGITTWVQVGIGQNQPPWLSADNYGAWECKPHQKEQSSSSPPGEPQSVWRNQISQGTFCNEHTLHAPASDELCRFVLFSKTQQSDPRKVSLLLQPLTEAQWWNSEALSASLYFRNRRQDSSAYPATQQKFLKAYCMLGTIWDK